MFLAKAPERKVDYSGSMTIIYMKTKLFSTVKEAFIKTKDEMKISLCLVLVLTVVLSIIFYISEHIAQPDVFRNFGDSFIWAYSRYIEGGDGVFDGRPVTVIGKSVLSLLGIIGIAIVAIPAGLIGSGFISAMEEKKRESELKTFEERLKKSFARKQCRYTKYRVVPPFVSAVDIQAKQGIDTKDIIETVAHSQFFRLRNLSTSQPLGEHPNDRLVVEHFPRNTNYGCMINRNSTVTIVSTSSSQEAGIGNFSYYLALLGGFNYVSKEVDVNPDEPFSYYNIANEEDDPNISSFLNDIKTLSSSAGSWVIFLLSASGAEEPSYEEDVHWLHGAKKGDSSFKDSAITVSDTKVYASMVAEVSRVLEGKYKLKSDIQKYHGASSKMYIGRHLQVEGRTVNACTLRMAYRVTVWNDSRISIAKDMAAIISQHLCGGTPTLEKSLKDKGLGYD